MSEQAEQNAKAWLKSIEDMCQRFDEAVSSETGDDQDKIREEICESVLSVEVRDGWRVPGPRNVEDGPDEYRLLLTTGGPALRIIGELDQDCEPSTARMEWQDWGTPWTKFYAPESTLLSFAAHFYFGE